MKFRKLFVFASVIAGIFIIALFVFMASQAAPAGSFFTFRGHQSAQVSGDGSTILAMRLISIPFGIHDSLAITGNGQIVTVTGWGICPSGGGDFSIKATISQVSLNGLAVGRSLGTCSGQEKVQWSADVNTPGSQTFSAGPAQACGHVVVHREGQGDTVGDWCANVTLAP
jgi:hypothetical protein